MKPILKILMVAPMLVAFTCQAANLKFTITKKEAFDKPAVISLVSSSHKEQLDELPAGQTTKTFSIPDGFVSGTYKVKVDAGNKHYCSTDTYQAPGKDIFTQFNKSNYTECSE